MFECEFSVHNRIIDRAFRPLRLDGSRPRIVDPRQAEFACPSVDHDIDDVTGI
jgi:hypothetical protein